MGRRRRPRRTARGLRLRGAWPILHPLEHTDDQHIYNIAASSVILAAAQQYPAGYNTTSAGLLHSTYPGERSAADAILSTSQSAANMTVLFDTVNSSQSYYRVFTSNVKGLVGYTDISSVLSGYEQYGSCYAYGEDVDGIAVANGICTDGNVFLQAHLSSSESFSQAGGGPLEPDGRHVSERESEAELDVSVGRPS